MARLYTEVRHSYLGVCQVQDVGSVAFLASSNGSVDLVARISAQDGSGIFGIPIEGFYQMVNSLPER